LPSEFDAATLNTGTDAPLGVSYVVPVFNKSRWLPAVLAALKNQRGDARVQRGDDKRWADPAFDDRAWPRVRDTVFRAEDTAGEASTMRSSGELSTVAPKARNCCTASAASIPAPGATTTSARAFA